MAYTTKQLDSFILCTLLEAGCLDEKMLKTGMRHEACAVELKQRSSHSTSSTYVCTDSVTFGEEMAR